ncbi:Hypothetical predicted protein [Paramuricea clavata]|uniref:Uncharacterized protein n=1 Tax=Paramuricea clavata TaxID=317549 RepID=A0A7D9L7Z0_PARCT|nr:Hypothetical predicted protein [Paramuricea clavata]
MATKTSNSSVFKDCVLEMEDSEVAQVVQLTKSDSVNIVDLHPFFGNNYNNQLFGDFEISLVNPIGREIIRTLDTEFNGFVTWTLNAGRKNVELRVHESPKDCTKTKRLIIHEFVAKSIFERIVSNMKQLTDYKICYSFPRRRNRRDSSTRLCKPDDFTKLYWHNDYYLLYTTYWKSLEEKYLELKRIIYDACRDRQGDNHDGNTSNLQGDDNDEGNTSNLPGQNETALPVVSKEVYEIIREKFLPYHTNIFYFILKVLWVVAFSCGIFELVNMLHAFHIAAAVQVVTTAGVGIMPHVFNMVALKISKEKDKAWNEKLKLNVKYILKGRIEERAKTVLIIQDSDDTVAGNLTICSQLKAAAKNEANNYERIPIPLCDINLNPVSKVDA